MTAVILAAVYGTVLAGLAAGLWLNAKLEDRRWRFRK